jgi:hypothetical protein
MSEATTPEDETLTEQMSIGHCATDHDGDTGHGNQTGILPFNRRSGSSMIVIAPAATSPARATVPPVTSGHIRRSP